jgi:prepilin peptidase CpaA
MPSAALPLLIFPALMLAAAAGDVAHYRIPNWLCAALALAFPAAALIAGLPPLLIGAHLALGLLAFLLCAGLFALNWMGGGDAKLIAAAVLWLGPSGGPDFLLATALAGGLLALLLIALRSAPVRPRVPAGQAWLARLAAPGGPAPYGVAICAGALAAMPAAAVFKTLFPSS